LKRVLFEWHAKIIERYMKSICRGFDSILVIADKDSNKLNGFYANPVVAVPNYVDTAHYAPDGPRHGSKSPTLLFTGAMKWWPNQDAVSFFVRDVLPLIDKDCPDIAFHVVGKDADALVQSGHGKVSATGFVEDLSVYYRSCDVYVCPLRKGTGIKNKVLEAMACGCAVVASRVAAEGLDVRDGQELLIADAPAEIATAIKRLVGEPELRHRLGAAARSFVEGEFSPAAMRAGLEKAVEPPAGHREPTSFKNQ
jgi:glycosyltransferase involved in cell wall biosynthesis